MECQACPSTSLKPGKPQGSSLLTTDFLNERFIKGRLKKVGGANCGDSQTLPWVSQVRPPLIDRAWAKSVGAVENRDKLEPSVSVNETLTRYGGDGVRIGPRRATIPDGDSTMFRIRSMGTNAWRKTPSIPSVLANVRGAAFLPKASPVWPAVVNEALTTAPQKNWKDQARR